LNPRFIAGILVYLPQKTGVNMKSAGANPKLRLQEIPLSSNGYDHTGQIIPQIPFSLEGKVRYEDVFRVAKEFQKLKEQTSYRTERACLDLRHADGPIAIVYSSDWHLGSLGCDYDQMQNDLDYILNTPRLGLATVGDLKDNFGSFKNVSAVHGQAFAGDLQNLVLEDIASRLVEANKLWIITWDNHSVEFDERVIGYEAANFIWREGVRKGKTIALDGEGFVELYIGDTFYTHLIMHQSRSHNSAHKLAGNKRLYQTRFPAHVVATGHTHSPDFEQYTHYEIAEALGYEFGGRSYLIKTGTYKIKDTYSQRYFGQPSIGTPTVVYFPMEKGKRKHLCFPTAEDAVQYMNGSQFLYDFHEANNKTIFST
jgi:hypothetical protein